jgi:Fe-S cluster assembly iron-binding protein IscA
MLSMTTSAASVLDTVREQQGIPEQFVVRVFPNPTVNGLEVQMSFAPEPAEGDQVTETEGTKLCVHPDLAEPLADTVIDAEQTPEGPELVLRR